MGGADAWTRSFSTPILGGNKRHCTIQESRAYIFFLFSTQQNSQIVRASSTRIYALSREEPIPKICSTAIPSSGGKNGPGSRLISASQNPQPDFTTDDPAIWPQSYGGALRFSEHHQQFLDEDTIGSAVKRSETDWVSLRWIIHCPYIRNPQSGPSLLQKEIIPLISKHT